MSKVKINRNSGSLIMSIVEVVIGILLLISPETFTAAIIILVGAVLAVLGVKNLIGYFRAAPEVAARTGGLSKGVLMTIGGLFCMFKSGWFIDTFPILTVVYGVFTVVTGVNKVQWAIDRLRMGSKYWYVALIGALLTLVFAVLILANPFGTVEVLWTFTGIVLIVEAVLDIVAFFMGKQKAE